MKLLKVAMFFAVISAVAACGGSPSEGTDGGDGGTGGGTAGGTGGGIAVAPTVTSTHPADAAQNVALNTRIAATFSTPMLATTLTASTFTVQQGTTAVSGSVTYAGSTATFTPAAPLMASSGFTATVSASATDLAGNGLAAPYSWTFTTGTTNALGPAPVGLGTAGNYVVLAKTGVSSVPMSHLTGNVGLSPAAASYITGFSLVADATNVFSTSTQVVGKVYAANYAVPTPSRLTTAVSNMEAAYTDAASRPTPDHLELGTGNIGGLTLAPGLYKWTSAITIPTDVTIAGGANDVWIFQTSGNVSLTAAKNVTLSGGAQARNIFWQVAGQVTLGANSHFEGIILSKTAITLQTGATMNGRALAQTDVILQQATVTQPAQ